MKIKDLAVACGGRAVAGESVSIDTEIRSGAALDRAREQEASFFADARHREALQETSASVVVMDEAAEASLSDRRHARIVHPRPAAAFGRILDLLHPEAAPPPGTHASAVVEEGARVHDLATVGPLAFVGRDAKIGARTRLEPGAYVGPGAEVGEDCVIGPRAVVEKGCVLGDRVRLGPSAVVGSDGFGYAQDVDEDGRPFHRKIPQVGRVRVEGDVEIGAGACIDRATTGETVIGRGAKIDNLVQVGHNCVVGPLSILCGQVGLAGSTRLGAGVVLGGQVGVAGHLTVGDGAKAAAQSGIASDVPAGETFSGSPAVPHRTWMRAALIFKDLPALVRRVRRLEKKIGSG